MTIALGPNKVINSSSDKKMTSPPPKLTTSKTTPVITFSSSVLPAQKTPWDAGPTPSRSSELTNPLFTVLQQSFLLLNSSKPELTASCRRCYSAKMPCYEEIAVVTLINYSNWQKQKGVSGSCQRQSNTSLTLKQVSGQGLCTGTVTVL